MTKADEIHSYLSQILAIGNERQITAAAAAFFDRVDTRGGWHISNWSFAPGGWRITFTCCNWRGDRDYRVFLESDCYKVTVRHYGRSGRSSIAELCEDTGLPHAYINGLIDTMDFVTVAFEERVREAIYKAMHEKERHLEQIAERRKARAKERAKKKSELEAFFTMGAINDAVTK